MKRLPPKERYLLPLLDIVTLLANVRRGAEHPEVGFEDADNTLDMLTTKLNERVFVDTSVLESALWSCNLLDEHGQFWDPKGRTLDEFIRGIVREDRFNKRYNVIEKESKDG